MMHVLMAIVSFALFATLGPSELPANQYDAPPAGVGSALRQTPTCFVEVVATPSLNLRAGPSTGDAVLTRARTGTRWQIDEVVYADLSQSRADEWVRLRLPDGRTAWGAAYYNNDEFMAYDVTQDCLDVRFPEPNIELPNACDVLMRVTARVRSGPGTNNVSSGTLPTGALVAITQVQADASYVWAQHSRGWSAIYARGTNSWWVAVPGAQSAACQSIPGWAESGLGSPPGTG